MPRKPRRKQIGSPIGKPMLAYINERVALQSLLWDLDLMPEQLEKDTENWTKMCAIVRGFFYHEKDILSRKEAK